MRVRLTGRDCECCRLRRVSLRMIRRSARMMTNLPENFFWSSSIRAFSLMSCRAESSRNVRKLLVDLVHHQTFDEDLAADVPSGIGPTLEPGRRCRCRTCPLQHQPMR